MEIVTEEGIDIFCLPDNGMCEAIGLHPTEIDKCPLKEFGEDFCIPERCPYYTEKY